MLEDEPTQPSRLSATEAVDPQWMSTRKRLRPDGHPEQQRGEIQPLPATPSLIRSLGLEFAVNTSPRIAAMPGFSRRHANLHQQCEFLWRLPLQRP